MSAIRDGLYAHLSGDATLTSMLPDGAAGVFADAERPEGVSLPCVQIAGDVEYETLSGDGGVQVARAIRVLADRTGDQAQIDAIAERVRFLFDGAGLAGLAFSGYSGGTAFVSGPVETDPDDESYGRLMQVSLRLILE